MIDMKLIAAAYKEPKSYDELMKPVLKWFALGSMLVGTGVFVGHMMIADTLLTFVTPARLEEAKNALNTSKSSAYLFQFAGMLIFVLDVFLYIVAEKAAKWKSKE